MEAGTTLVLAIDLLIRESKVLQFLNLDYTLFGIERKDTAIFDLPIFLMIFFKLDLR